MKKRLLALILAIATVISVFAITTVPAYADDKLYEIKNKILDYQPTYPLKEFPVSTSSYFNDYHFDNDGKEKPCEHHRDGKNDNCSYEKKGVCDCTIYSSSIQCMAFAKYAYDQYSHRSVWSDVIGDRYLKGADIGSTTKATNELINLKYGSYVRLDISKTNNKGHSFIVLSTSASGVTMYDANFMEYTCKVDKHFVSYEKIGGKYGIVREAYCHIFPELSNSTQHIIK